MAGRGSGSYDAITTNRRQPIHPEEPSRKEIKVKRNRLSLFVLCAMLVAIAGGVTAQDSLEG
ncbi:MAG: hypothetical protein PVF47_10270, partial [Anaerolineae bacterium]